MKEIFLVEPKINLKKNENTKDIRIFKKEKVDFAINNIGLKLSPKWNRMEILQTYFKKNFYPFILKGLFDTDGSVTIFKNNGILYPRIEIKICPSPIQEQIKDILNELNLNYKIQYLEKRMIRIRISGVSKLQKWFKIIGSSNPVHLNKMKVFLNS